MCVCVCVCVYVLTLVVLCLHGPCMGSASLHKHFKRERAQCLCSCRINQAPVPVATPRTWPDWSQEADSMTTWSAAGDYTNWGQRSSACSFKSAADLQRRRNLQEEGQLPAEKLFC